jgi:hypothetical protein
MSLLLPKPTVGLSLLCRGLVVDYMRGYVMIFSHFAILLPHRFQRKEYANIEIVQTEKKGFGLRAGADLRKWVQLT